MSSLEIAELTGKEHKHVIRDIRKMLTELGNLADQVWATRIDQRGKEQVHAILDHDHVMCLVTGYKVQLRMAVIQRLRALESGEATPWYEQQQSAVQLPDFTNPAEAARAWAEQYDRADTVSAKIFVPLSIYDCARKLPRAGGSVSPVAGAEVGPRTLLPWLVGWLVEDDCGRMERPHLRHYLRAVERPLRKPLSNRPSQTRMEQGPGLVKLDRSNNSCFLSVPALRFTDTNQRGPGNG